jgi:hypothetical protein
LPRVIHILKIIVDLTKRWPNLVHIWISSVALTRLEDEEKWFLFVSNAFCIHIGKKLFLTVLSQKHSMLNYFGH